MEAKKKTVKKLKEKKKVEGQHWSLFEYSNIWNEKRLQQFLDDYRDAIEDGVVHNLSQFSARQNVSIPYLEVLAKRHPFFKAGLNVLKDLLYAKRFEMCLEDPDSIDLFTRFGLHNYDALTRISKQEERIEKREDIKDIATHTAMLKKEEDKNLADTFKPVMIGSDGKVYLSFGGKPIEEEQWKQIQSHISTTSDHTGTNNKS